MSHIGLDHSTLINLFLILTSSVLVLLLSLELDTARVTMYWNASPFNQKKLRSWMGLLLGALLLSVFLTACGSSGGDSSSAANQLASRNNPVENITPTEPEDVTEVEIPTTEPSPPVAETPVTPEPEPPVAETPPAEEPLPQDVIISASSSSPRFDEICITWEYDDSAFPNLAGFIVFDDNSNEICRTQDKSLRHLDCSVTVVDGTMNFSMAAYDISGNVSEKSPVVPAKKKPVAAIVASGLNRSVHFDATDSMDYDNGSIVSYSWNMGDGNVYSGLEVDHDFQPGEYTITLEVTDNEGASSIAELVLSIV